MDENKNEVELLRIENKDLTQKLETLKQKRKDDYPKFTEFEKNAAELKALQELKMKLIESNSKLQRQLQEKEKELNEQIKADQEKYEQLSELEERLEMTTVEKEVAEERAELLQVEVEIEKQRAQELEIELDLLRSKIEQTGDGILQDDGIQLKLLGYQNEKLREALIRMRDIVGQLTEDKRELSQGNETLRNESAALVKICENLKKEYQKAVKAIAVLKDQIEATADSEKTIEILTEKNIDLEKKLSTLEETVEDYEAIRTMDEEILETQREAERELREEFDLANGRITNLLAQIKIYGEQVDEYEKMIMKFRRKVGELNEEIQERQDEIIILTEQLKREGNGDTMSAQSTQLTTATRTFAEIVDGEVCAVELRHEIEMSNYLKAFLPDNFSKPGGDGDAVLLTVLCSRLSAKTIMLIKLLNLKYPPAPGGIRREHVTKSHKAEQWAQCAKFSFLLSSFCCAVRKCGSAVRRCTAEQLSRLAPLQNDIAKEEQMIDHYIGLLKNDKFDENTPTSGVDKGISYLENVLSIHLSREWYDTKQIFLDVCVQLLQGLLWVKISAHRIIFALSLDTRCSTAEYMESVLTWVERCEQLCTRLKNRVSAGKRLIFTQDLEIQLTNWNTSLKNVASIFDIVCSISNIQLSTITEADSLEENCIQESFLCSVEKVHGTLNGTEATEVINEYMTVVENLVSDFIDKFDVEELSTDLTDQFLSPPLMERANARRQDALEVEKLRWNLEKKDSEITELKMNLRAKLNDISNYKLRLEMAENKIESMGKIDEHEMQKLCSQNDDLRDQLRKTKIEYEDALEALQHEIDSYEKENCELRNRARTISRKVLLGQLQTMNMAGVNHSKTQALFLPPTPSDSLPSTAEQFNEVAYLEAQLKETKMALEWAHQHIRQLKANERMQMLNVMNPITNSSDICGPLTLLSAQVSEKDELDVLCRRAESILADSRFYQIPYVADISQPKSKQELEKKNHLAIIAHINQRIIDVAEIFLKFKNLMFLQLKIDMHRFWSKYHRGGEIPSLFKNIESITSNSRKEEEITTENNRVKGVHSEAYKDAFESLFGDLNTGQKRIESAKIAVCV
uniref:Dynein associated protein domain-containing protein n=1 Tax=Setaria digitata TaxID=48799 RepID=A0A915PUP0_9BILA